MRYNTHAKKTGFALSLLAAAVLVGCDTNTTTIATPNPDTLTPEGTVIGVLTDASTGEAVVGARITVGNETAVTNTTGHYVLDDLPVNTYVNGGAISGMYTAVIDTSRVTSPANANYATLDTTCNMMNVVFSSQAESTGGAGGASSGAVNSNTPIEGLVATADLTIGQLTGRISGMVYDTDGITPLEGVSVNVSLNDALGGCAGGIRYVGSTVTTDANGAYTITALEEGLTPTVNAFTDDNEKTGTTGALSAISKINNTIVGEDGAGDNANITLGYNDNIAPSIANTSRETGADIAPGVEVSIDFTWTETVEDSVYTRGITPDLSAAADDTIYDDVTVNYNGAKAGNIAHTLMWLDSADAASTTPTNKLRVTIPAAAMTATSQYTVSAAATVGAGAIRDVAGNNSVAGVNAIIVFTTNGGTDLSTIAPGVAVTQNSFEWSDTSVSLDWLPITGASEYNVYRTTTTAGVTGPTEMISAAGGVTNSSYTDTPVAFFAGEFAQSYTYEVAAVNANYEEGALSTPDVVADDTALQLTAVSGIIVGASANTCMTSLTFSGPVQEATAETVANYTYNLGTIQGASAAPLSATLTSGVGLDATVNLIFSDPNPGAACADFTDDADSSETLLVRDSADANNSVLDLEGNEMDAAFNVWDQDTNTID